MKRKILVSGIGLVLFILFVTSIQTLNAKTLSLSSANCGFDVDKTCCIAGSRCGCLLPEPE